MALLLAFNGCSVQNHLRANGFAPETPCYAHLEGGKCWERWGKGFNSIAYTQQASDIDIVDNIFLF
jgi:hypothetical protein